MSRRVLVLHGPNLNLEAVLGRPLAALDAELLAQARAAGLELESVQANGEAALLDALHAKRAQLFAVIVNPSSLAPTAYGLADALEALALPCVEVLLAHETKARGKSALRRVVDKQFHGQGAAGYTKALASLSKQPAALPEKTIGRGKVAKAANEDAVRIEKTIGRAKPKAAVAVDAVGANVAPSGLVTRAAVKQQVLARLKKSTTPDAFAQWARTQWLAVQNGAPVEAGQRELLESLLLALSTSAKASDHVMLSYAAKLGE